jgi:hypothetical protein
LEETDGHGPFGGGAILNAVKDFLTKLFGNWPEEVIAGK